MYNCTHLRINTLNSYKNSVEKHIIPALGEYRLQDIREHHLQEFLTKTGNSEYGKKNKKKYSEKSLKEIRSVLYQIFNQAVDNQLIAQNPAKKLKVTGLAKKERLPLTKAQIEIALKVAEHHYIGLLVFLMYYCGLRRGEALALTVQDISGDYVVINKQVIYPDPGKKATLSQPKTKAGNRKIPIPNPLKERLNMHIQELKNKGIFNIFPGNDSGYMQHSFVRCKWDNFVSRCNIVSNGNSSINVFGHITEHQLRHTYCTHLYNIGVDLLTAKQYMGHDDVNTTLAIYTHLTEEKENEAARTVLNWEEKKPNENETENKKSIQNG